MRGWAWVWLLLAVASALVNSLSPLLRVPMPYGANGLVLYAAIAVAVLVAQRAYSASRAAVAVVIALVVTWLLFRGYFALVGGLFASRFGQMSSLSLSLVGQVGFVLATIAAVVSLRRSARFVVALAAALISFALPVIGLAVASGLSWRGYQVIGESVATTVFLDAAVPFASVWIGTKMSHLVVRVTGSQSVSSDSRALSE